MIDQFESCDHGIKNDFAQQCNTIFNMVNVVNFTLLRLLKYNVSLCQCMSISYFNAQVTEITYQFHLVFSLCQHTL